MRIGIDVRHLRGGAGTGGARVLSLLLTAFTRHAPHVEWRPFNRFRAPLWHRHAAGKAVAAVIADVLVKNLVLPVQARRERLDALLYVLPPVSFTVRRTPQIVCIHDLPTPDEERSLPATIYNDVFIRQSCRRADRIVTGSQSAETAIRERYGVARDRITTVPYPIDTDAIAAVAPLDGAPGRDGYFMGILSRLGWRKHPGAYLKSYARLPADLRRRYPLVLAGAVRSLDDLRPYADADLLAAVREDVICMGRISDDRLMGCLKGATALLFPSRHEGFGLPVLEAVACGVPVVASDIPPFRELFSEVAVLLDPDDADGMAAALASIVNRSEPGLTECQRQAFLERYSLASYAQRMEQVLKETVQ